LRRRAGIERIDPDRIGDVREFDRAEIAGREIEPTFHLTMGVLGQADRAGFGNPLRPRCDIDAVAHKIADGLFNHIAQMDADRKLDTAPGRQANIAFDHATLRFDCAAH
jgi:hypothetical protein